MRFEPHEIRIKKIKNKGPEFFSLIRRRYVHVRML